jgi:hypothetical protein
MNFAACESTAGYTRHRPRLAHDERRGINSTGYTGKAELGRQWRY